MDLKEICKNLGYLIIAMFMASGCVFDPSGFAFSDSGYNQNNTANSNNTNNVNNNNGNCIPTNGGVEICDEVDNNCDGQVDEGFDFVNDPDNCGSCENSCTYPNASAQCLGGLCALMTCNTGWVDLNQDPVNGCEYQCTVTNGGVEICDNLDNNCNGQTDEGFDLQNDPNNCGFCGNVCNFAHAGSECASGQCEMLDCSMSGTSHTWWDLNDDPIDGCEYQCQITMGGHEVCDGLDNNCNGQADENCGSLKLLFQFGDAWTTWPSYIADLSGNGNDGVAYGGASLACNAGDFVPGEDQDSCSVSFDGTGQIEIPENASLDITGAITIAAWIKTTALEGDVVSRKFNSTDHTWKLKVKNGHVLFAWADGFEYNPADILEGSINVSDGQWHFIVAVGDPSISLMSIYIDGQPDGSKTKTTVPASASVMVGVGNSINSSFYFVGNIDEITVYSNALSLNKIQSVYNLYQP